MPDERIISRLDKLVGEGQYLAAQLERPDIHSIQRGRFIGWKTSTLALLRDILPENHTYLQEFQKTIILQDFEHLVISKVDGGVNILERLSDDIKRGYLTKFKTRITAEVFEDFIEMSKHLLTLKYLESAAALSTAVLENGLRHIANDNGVPISKKDTLGPLNDKCATAGVYISFWHKQINSWLGIRNYVDHGEFDKFSKIPKQEIKNMIDGIENFLALHYE